MWFKNTKTGLVWKIVDKEHIKELKKLDYFIEVADSDETSKDAPKFTKHNDQSQECDVCGKVLKNSKALKAHKRMAHEVNKDGDK